jgi:hypothetical protein
MDLDRNLKNEGAKFDIVHTKTFSALKQEGIIKALIDAISWRRLFRPQNLKVKVEIRYQLFMN